MLLELELLLLEELLDSDELELLLDDWLLKLLDDSELLLLELLLEASSSVRPMT